jgi:galactokinase
VLEGHVGRQRARQDYSGVSTVGMDETAAARGQDYVSVFMDSVPMTWAVTSER